MVNKPLDMRLIYKRQRELLSNKFYDDKLHESVDLSNIQDSNIYKETVKRYVKDLTSYRDAINLLESLFTDNKYGVLESTTQNVIYDIIPKIKPREIKRFISYVENANIGDINKDRLIEAAKEYKSIDRILDNHNKLSKRFELESFSDIRKSDNEKCISICELVDTYSISPFIKMNIALEELILLSYKNGYNIEKNVIVENVLNYFLLRKENTEKDIQSYKRAINESRVLSNDSISKIRWFIEENEQNNLLDDYLEESWESKLNSWKVDPNKDIDTLVKLFRENCNDLYIMNRIIDTMNEFTSINNMDQVTLSYIINGPIDENNISVTNNLLRFIAESNDTDSMKDIYNTLVCIKEADETDKMYADGDPEDPVTFSSDEIDTFKMQNLITDAQRTAEFLDKMNNMMKENMIYESDIDDSEINKINLENFINYIDENGYITIKIKSYKNDNDIDHSFIETCIGCINNILSNTNSKSYCTLENGKYNIYLRSKYQVYLTEKESLSKEFSYEEMNLIDHILECDQLIRLQENYFKILDKKLYDRSYAANVSVEEADLLFEMVADKDYMDQFINLCKEEANPDYDKMGKNVEFIESSYDIEHRLQLLCELLHVSYTNDDGESVVCEAFDLNTLRLAWQAFKAKAKKFSAKEKEASRDLDSAFNNLLRGLKQTFTVDHREQIIKGQVTPSLSRMLKIILSIGAAGTAIGKTAAVSGALGPMSALYVSAIIAVGAYAVSKRAEQKEKAMILDEIDIELKVLDRELERAQSSGSPKKYRALLTIQKNLQRERQRIHYGLASKGKRIPMPSTAGLKGGND